MTLASKISAVGLILYCIVFNRYLWLISHEYMDKVLQKRWCYSAYLLILIPLIYSVSKGIKTYRHKHICCASLFVLIYTYIAILINYAPLGICGIYNNLICFNFGVLLSILIVGWSYR